MSLGSILHRSNGEMTVPWGVPVFIDPVDEVQWVDAEDVVIWVSVFLTWDDDDDDDDYDDDDEDDDVDEMAGFLTQTFWDLLLKESATHRERWGHTSISMNYWVIMDLSLTVQKH